MKTLLPLDKHFSLTRPAANLKLGVWTARELSRIDDLKACIPQSVIGNKRSKFFRLYLRAQSECIVTNRRIRGGLPISFQEFLKKKESFEFLLGIISNCHLLVPQLPHPPFRSHQPPRFFWHPVHLADQYAPECLIPDTKEEMPVVIHKSSPICAYARVALDQKGTLQQDRNGCIYLELSDAYITELFPLIQADGCEAIQQPVHIPVILPNEWVQRKGWGKIKELGQTFSFKILELCALESQTLFGKQIDTVYFLKIDAPELEQLRQRYLLPSRIRGHAFHIAIGFGQTTPQRTLQRETFRLNVSCFAA